MDSGDDVEEEEEEEDAGAGSIVGKFGLRHNTSAQYVSTMLKRLI